MKKLDIIATIKDGIALGLLNYVSVIVTVILYVLTVWIPYLNVGTTIALTLLPAELAKGKMINPLYIFDGKFRRNMGEYFLLSALMFVGILMGYLFLFIPGIVIAYAWNFAMLLFVDKNMLGFEALRESNKYTYGNKWRMFAIQMILVAIIWLCEIIIGALFGIGNVQWLETIGTIITILIALAIVPISLGVTAVMYKKLVLEADQPVEEPAAPIVPAEEPADPVEDPVENQVAPAEESAAE